MRHLRVALPLSLALLAAMPAAAQHSGFALVEGSEPRTVASPRSGSRLQFRSPEGDLRLPPPSRRNGLIAAFPIDHNVEIGIGRFSVADHARMRTNMESERHPTAVRPRDRGIAAVGVSFRF
ncbi:hypothetical protein [Sphingosinicella terrae]|uniref:hypothetical protein n=1 Tax=Sphingosinicella terrae TaxID=2172047 RepID=UPI000E0DE00A|nr:hypothetical protein [Sphingosinicella terrae]